jgi:DNA-binding MarR family transcriptional regulator
MAPEHKNPADISTKLPVLVKKLNQCLTISQESFCRKYDLTVAEAALVSAMEPDRKLCSTALMERQELSKGRISRIVESLNRKGYLIKVEHHDDRRHNIIELTGRGRAVRQAIVEEQDAQCHRVLAHVPEEKRSAILPALEQLVEALERAKRETGTLDTK